MEKLLNHNLADQIKMKDDTFIEEYIKKWHFTKMKFLERFRISN